MNDFVEVEHIKRTYELRRFPPKAYNFFIQTAQMNESNQRTAMRGHLSSGKYGNNNESQQASTNGRYILKEDQEFPRPSENFPSKRVRSTDGMNVVLRSKVERRSRFNMSLPQVTALSQKDSQGQTVKTHNSHGLVKIHPGRNVTSDGFGSTVKPNEVDRMTRGPDFQSITKRSDDPSSMRHGNSQSFSSICQNIWTSDSGHQQSTRDCVRPYQNSFVKAVNEDIYENCQNIHHDSSSHWIEAETGRVAILEEEVRQISEERRSLIAQNSALAYKLRKSAQLVSENEYLDQVLLRVQTIVKRIKHEHLMLRSEMDQLLQELCTYTGDEGIETLRIKLRELEKRCALQQLLQEEVLLELEGARKRERLTEANEQLFSSADQAYRSTLADFSNISLSTSGLAKVDYANYNRSTEATDFSLGSGSTGSTTRVNIKRCVLGSGPVAVGKPVTSDEQDPNLVELFQTSDEPFEISDIRAPRMLTLERQLVHSVLISWKPPDVTTTGQTVSAYHVYVDGQFRLAVKAKEKTRALLDRVDADKPHRISVRAISTKGQSKDAACTLVVGRGMTATPGRLRATQITTNSAKLSWMPGNSNYWHRIFLNQQELCTCPPGVYKILLTDLPPDALHWVCVQAVVQKTNIPESQKSPMSIICSPRSGVDTQKLAAFIEFRTLPIGLPDPPTNVQLEPGPQDGMLLVTWLPVPQDQGAAAAATAAGAGITLPVQGYTVCLNENSLVEVAESTNDHAIIPLQQIKCHLEAAGTTSSVTRSSETETSEATLADNRQLSPDLPDTGIPQHLFITVHSTVPREATESKTAFANSESPIKSNILKGAAGPGSLPVNLTAGLLLASAGSLQAARRIFGSRLSLHLGIDEAAAKRAGVPLIVEREMSTSPPPTTQVGHVSTLDPGLVMVSADLTARKLSPTADAIGSAEHKAHTSGHPVHSVPEIQIHQDSETSGPPRRTRSKHMDLRGYHEELRPELTPQHFKITEQLVDPCSQQPKFVHAPKSSVEGRRKLQNTTALPGTAPFLSNYPSEPPFPSTSGTHDTTHINTSSRVPQELTQPVPPPVALDEFQRSYHKDGGDQSSTYGLPVQQRFQDTKALRFVVALYAYDPATMSPNPDAVQEELPFQEGQIIKIFGDCDEDGFYYGECNGLRGLVPSNMVSKPERDIGPTDSTYPGTSNRMEQVMNQERPRYPEGPSLPPGQLSRPRHRHYGTMHASHQNVPSHQISDTMTGRPYGSTSAIQNGVAFAAQSHSRRSPLDNPPLPQCKSTNTVANLYAQEDPCYDFSRQPSMREPSLRTSQQPISRQMRAPQLAGANDPGKQSLPGMSRQMVALYDYDPSVLSPNADADRELSFRSGERIVVYGEMDEDGFYEGELSDGRRGLVPSNFLRDIRTDIDPMDRRASITARSSQKRSQADSGSFMNSTYKNETSQAPTGPSTSAGYRRDQEKLVPLGREQLRGMNFGRKTAGGQLGIHDESKDVKYVQARMSQGRHGIEEDPYWDQQSTFEGDAQKW